MKKKYIVPAIRVKRIEEAYHMMAASNNGLIENSKSGFTEDDVTGGSSVSRSSILAKPLFGSDEYE